MTASALPPLGSLEPGEIIEIHGLDVPSVIGCYPHERDAPQPLRLDVRIALAPQDLTRLGDTLDYVQLAGVARFVLQRARFTLLESAALALCRTLLAPAAGDAPRPRPVSATIRLTKPLALGGHGVPSVTCTRRADELAFEVEDTPFGAVDNLHEQPDVSLYRLRIAPGQAIAIHVHRALEEHELILGTGLQLQGRAVRAGSAFAWPPDHPHPHRYDNPSPTEQSILCIDRPAFTPVDEIPVDVPVDALCAVPCENLFAGGSR